MFSKGKFRFFFFWYFSPKPKSPDDAMDLSVALKGCNVKNTDNKKEKKKKKKTGNRTSQAS